MKRFAPNFVFSASAASAAALLFSVGNTEAASLPKICSLSKTCSCLQHTRLQAKPFVCPLQVPRQCDCSAHLGMRTRSTLRSISSPISKASAMANANQSANSRHSALVSEQELSSKSRLDRALNAKTWSNISSKSKHQNFVPSSAAPWPLVQTATEANDRAVG